jgi:hypothetical protein
VCTTGGNTGVGYGAVIAQVPSSTAGVMLFDSKISTTPLVRSGPSPDSGSSSFSA